MLKQHSLSYVRDLERKTSGVSPVVNEDITMHGHPENTFSQSSAASTMFLPQHTMQDVSAGIAHVRQGEEQGNTNFNLDEIFGDYFFRAENPVICAPLTEPASVWYTPNPSVGPVDATHLGLPAVMASVLVPSTTVDQQQMTSKSDRITKAVVAPCLRTDITTTADSLDSTKKRRRVQGERKMNDQQKVERRERNREHAKRSRIRKKFLLDSLQESAERLKRENEKLRNAIKTHLGDEKAADLLDPKTMLNQTFAPPTLPDAKAIQAAQQHFFVTDPSLPDNPIVYATQGFLNLTGYTLEQVLGRNCLFMQGPETDTDVAKEIRDAIEDGVALSVCLLNYRADGTKFWNHVSIAVLRDETGHITNYLVSSKTVNEQDLSAPAVTSSNTALEQVDTKKEAGSPSFNSLNIPIIPAFADNDKALNAPDFAFLNVIG